MLFRAYDTTTSQMKRLSMGTNYYFESAATACPTCKHNTSEPLHIGKSSGGWCFSLHVIPDQNLNDFESWKTRFNEAHSTIKDEYGCEFTPNEMLEIITKREFVGNQSLRNDIWFSRNSAVEGPNGLARHHVDGQYCIGHGDGTYDYLQGYFS